MMDHSTVAGPAMGQKSGNRRAHQAPRNPLAVRRRRDLRQQSEGWGRPAAPARARCRRTAVASWPARRCWMSSTRRSGS